MEVSVEKSSELQRRLTVKVPSEQIEQMIDSRLKKLGKQVKLKGFRPGRVPYKVLRQRYGKSVKQEVISELVQQSLFEAIDRESLKPVSNPVLEDLPDMAEKGDLEFTASIEVYPEIPGIDASQFEMNRPQAEVTSRDVDDMLETLREQKQTWEDIEDKAGEGDQVIVEFSAETKEGRVPEEGKNRMALVIGTSGFDALEKALLKLESGASKKMKLSFPEQFSNPQLAGQKASVELDVLQVQRADKPEIDEEFIRSFAVESGSLEDLRTEVRGNLERELDQANKSYLKAQLVQNLLKAHKNLQVPESMVMQEAESIRIRQAQAQRVEPDTFPLEAFREVATARMRSGMLLAEIARQNNIVIDGARVRKAIETVAQTFEKPLEVVQMYYGNQQLLASVENIVLEEQVVDWVMEQAKVSDQEMAFKEVINAAAAAGQTL